MCVHAVAGGYRPRQVFGGHHASIALIGSWRQPLGHGIVVPSCASDFVITSLQVLQKKTSCYFGLLQRSIWVEIVLTSLVVVSGPVRMRMYLHQML